MSGDRRSPTEEVALREIWPDEANDFTPWLYNNLSLLGESLHLDLQPVGREEPVGEFFADILAFDPDIGIVVIENQFQSTNHSHLGKLLTYAANFRASALIWISRQFRPEHMRSLELLNALSGTELKAYGVEIALRLGNGGELAPEFVPVITPQGWSAGDLPLSSRAERAESEARERSAFLDPILAGLTKKGLQEKTEPPRRYGHYFASPSGMDEVHFGVVHLPRQHVLSAQVRLGHPDIEHRNQLFDHLATRRRFIESRLREGLTWDRGNENNWASIRVTRGCPLDAPETHLQDVQEWALGMFPRFVRTLDSELVRASDILEPEQS